MKKIYGVVAALAVASALVVPATRASAAEGGAVVGACRIQLPVWPTYAGDRASCGTGLPGEGLAVGAYLPGGLICAPGPCTFQASIDTYSEDCIAFEPSLTGDASGTLTIVSPSTNAVPGKLLSHFTWVRVGAAVVVLFDQSAMKAGVATFTPFVLPGRDLLPTCLHPGPLTVDVAGLSVAAE